jgi:Mg2+/Co2+ transporter CorB
VVGRLLSTGGLGSTPGVIVIVLVVWSVVDKIEIGRVFPKYLEFTSYSHLTNCAKLINLLMIMLYSIRTTIIVK